MNSFFKNNVKLKNNNNILIYPLKILKQVIFEFNN